MRITKRALRVICDEVSHLDYETGGILGSSDGITVDEIIMDRHKVQTAWRCAYAPDTEFLNQSIGMWSDNDIAFIGLFHTHFWGVKTLSCGDVRYIEAIMYAMPDEIRTLYFPIFVLPSQELICYRATRNHRAITIATEDLIVES